MRIFWTNKAYEEERKLWQDTARAKGDYRDAILALIESVYETDFNGKNGDEIYNILQAHDNKVFWDAYERGNNAGIRAAFHGMCSSGIMKKDTAEKFIKRITDHTHEEIEKGRAQVRQEIENERANE